MDAVQPRTGKGKLASVTHSIQTGRPAPTRAWGSENDQRNSILSALRANAKWIFWDNITKGAHIDSPSVCIYLTTDTFVGRILTTNTDCALPADAQVVFTGNQFHVVGDLAERTYMIRQDAKCERPGHRRGPDPDDPKSCWRFPNLLGWVKANRSELVGACFTIIGYWYGQGMPTNKHPVLPFGSFEGWQNIMGGILDTAGFKDFLGNRDAVTTYAAEQDEGRLVFLALAKFLAKPRTANEIFEASNDDPDMKDEFPESVLANFKAQTIGAWLTSNLRDVVVGSLVFVVHSTRTVHKFQIKPVKEDK